MDAIGAHAERHPEAYAGRWIDESIGIMTVTFTGDLAPHLAALAAATGGAVCVHGANFSQAELDAVRARVNGEPEALRSVGLEVISSYTDELENRVVFGVLYTDEAALRWVEDRYGGAVELQSFLKPA